MLIEPPYPTLDEMIEHVGDAGQRLAEIEASEGAAGNISVYIGWDVDIETRFPNKETIPLPTTATELVGRGFIVTGSGRRLREIHRNPEANLGFVRVEEGGRTGTLFTSPQRLFKQLTTEFNSHLAVHRDQISRNSINLHALIHAQPMQLVFLSHIARYQEMGYFSRHVLRWQPESIINLPEGIGFIPFMLPGSPELMLNTVRLMRDHKIVLWAKHGIMARSDASVKKACDIIEYAETGARYEYLNLTSYGIADGLTTGEIRMLCDAFKIQQNLF